MVLFCPLDSYMGREEESEERQGAVQALRESSVRLTRSVPTDSLLVKLLAKKENMVVAYRRHRVSEMFLFPTGKRTGSDNKQAVWKSLSASPLQARCAG